MKCIAHRGYSLKYKDNSVQGIKEALFRGYDGVEIDIQLCDTGEIVVFMIYTYMTISCQT